jgi:minor extracellular serine protease Vpr
VSPTRPSPHRHRPVRRVGSAGQGVRLDRTPYTGPYNGETHNTGFLIGPGVAPQASLYALKVFGCDGPTDADVDAINWAVEHDLDVINLRLGAPLGRNTDPSSVPANNAAKAGVVVVAAGNSGDGPYIANSPAVADGAIAVAAMDINRVSCGLC